MRRPRAKAAGAMAPRPFLHTDCDRMLREARPHTVIVTTVDATHDIVRALDAGCDVITEKPMTTNRRPATGLAGGKQASQGQLAAALWPPLATFRSADAG